MTQSKYRSIETSRSSILKLDTSYCLSGKANRTLQIGDVIRFVTDAPYDAMSGLYAVDGVEINTDFTISLALNEAATDAITGWSTSIETVFADEDI